jgi:hypothetical protein
MVARERLQSIVVPQIRAAVADVRHAGNLLPDPGAHHRGAHTRLPRILLCLVVDELVRPAHRVSQPARVRKVRLPVTARRGRTAFAHRPVDLSEDRLHGHLTRDFSGRRPAHAVAHDEQPVAGARPVRVLIEEAHASRIGARPDPQPHWHVRLQGPSRG